jgi:hypothetical protein
MHNITTPRISTCICLFALDRLRCTNPIAHHQSPVSRLVEDCLNTLAQKHNETRFVKLHYIEAEIDAAGVPAILAYKGGDMFANLVSVIDKIPQNRNLSSSSLELVLQQWVYPIPICRRFVTD